MNTAYLEKDKNRICASDGRCVIIIDVPEMLEIETGYYISVKANTRYFLMPHDVMGNKPTIKYPNVDKVIPDYSKLPYLFENQSYCLSNRRRFYNNQFYCELTLKIQGGIFLPYLEVLKRLGRFSVKGESCEKVVEFIGEGWKLLIMPMNRK